MVSRGSSDIKFLLRGRLAFCFFFSSRRRHTRYWRDWSSDVCSSDLTLYGNVPLITTPPQPTDRPATVGPPELWAQIEQDLTQARPVLPRSYSGNDLGRATWGAATALLGKAYMQQGKWSQAEAALAEVIGSGLYDLMPNYADNFT